MQKTILGNVIVVNPKQKNFYGKTDTVFLYAYPTVMQDSQKIIYPIYYKEWV